jgi:hypothetical protein
MEQVAHFEQRCIERLSIETDQGARRAQRVADGSQQLALVGVADEHELLRYERTIGLAPTAADQEGVGAGPTGKPGRLEVEEGEGGTRGRAARDKGRLLACTGQTHGKHTNLFTAVPSRRLIPPLDDKTCASPFAVER